MTIVQAINYIKCEMNIQDIEREYTNSFERNELIDLYKIQMMTDAKNGLSPSEFGFFVKELLEYEF